MKAEHRSTQARDLNGALAKCADVARSEHGTARAALASAIRVSRRLEADIQAETAKARRFLREDSLSPLRRLERTIEASIEAPLQELHESLERKQQLLSRFTIALFGRTMAGKSTIREAITRGDGTTIGNGAQRTTRDVREYEWQNLRILDTPGIGAYQGETDRQRALSIIDESDMILFLVTSDGIQEESFRAMRALREQNKPMLFVLNMKLDLEKAVYRRRFLRKPESVFEPSVVEGHSARLRRMAVDELGIRDPRIVPIHAQAAFLSTRPGSADDSELLWAGSRMSDLLELITAEVCDRGFVRRLRTQLDGTVIRVVDLQSLLLEEARVLRGHGFDLRRKLDEVNGWLDRFVREIGDRIDGKVEIAVAPLRKTIAGFVEGNLERPDVGKRWKEHAQAHGLEDWFKREQEELHLEVRKKLEAFSREFEYEQQLLEQLLAGSPSQVDPFDVKRTLRWISAGSGAAAGVAGLIALKASAAAAASFWNPAGIALASIAAGAFVLSWFFRSRDAKLQAGKRAAEQQLRDQVNEMAARLKRSLRHWFEKSVTRKVVAGVRSESNALIKAQLDFSDRLKKAADEFEEIAARLNRRLLARSAELSGLRNGGIAAVVRDPGFRTKVRWSGRTAPAALCAVWQELLDEPVDVVRDAPPKTMVSDALAPAAVVPSQVTLSAQGALVRLPRREIGKAIGRNGANVRLASRLVRRRIEVKAL